MLHPETESIPLEWSSTSKLAFSAPFSALLFQRLFDHLLVLVAIVPEYILRNTAPNQFLAGYKY